MNHSRGLCPVPIRTGQVTGTTKGSSVVSPGPSDRDGDVVGCRVGRLGQYDIPVPDPLLPLLVSVVPSPVPVLTHGRRDQPLLPSYDSESHLKTRGRRENPTFRVVLGTEGRVN